MKETLSEAEKNLATAKSNYEARDLDKKTLAVETALEAEKNQIEKSKVLIDAAKAIIEAVNEEGRERDRGSSGSS